MKKVFLCALVALCVVYKINAQEMTAVYNKNDSSASIKQTVYNTARFLRFEQNSLLIDPGGYGYDVPGLTYTFTLTKNTVVQISETVNFTTKCSDCIITASNTWFKNSIVIDRERFASFDVVGSDLYSNSGGTVLAQLGPGTHTIKIHVAVNEQATNATIYGYDKARGNRTFMSLLFFEQ